MPEGVFVCASDSSSESSDAATIMSLKYTCVLFSGGPHVMSGRGPSSDLLWRAHTYLQSDTLYVPSSSSIGHTRQQCKSTPLSAFMSAEGEKGMCMLGLLLGARQQPRSAPNITWVGKGMGDR